jgi:hypothetical protein
VSQQEWLAVDSRPSSDAAESAREHQLLLQDEISPEHVLHEELVDALCSEVWRQVAPDLIAAAAAAAGASSTAELQQQQHSTDATSGGGSSSSGRVTDECRRKTDFH